MFVSLFVSVCVCIFVFVCSCVCMTKFLYNIDVRLPFNNDMINEFNLQRKAESSFTPPSPT